MGETKSFAILQFIQRAKNKRLKKIMRYFVTGIIPVAFLAISPMLWKFGLFKGPDSTGLSVLLGLIIIGLAWGISAYHISLGLDTLKSLARFLRFGRRFKVRILRIDFPSINNPEEKQKLYFFEKEVHTLFGKRWIPIKNRDLFFELRNSKSIAYFPDKQTALARIGNISNGEWKINTEFDTITIENEYYV